MKLGSLFDGIGGFPLAATLHGITPIWASEIESFPVAITKHHFPDMLHLGDIAQINGAEIEPVDIITFGSPCQDLSVAGKRGGLESERSGLFHHAIRIIREMRGATDGRYPRFAVWENVPGAFSSNGGADFQAVLEEITESTIPMPNTGRWATAGMVRGGKCEVAWRVLDAQYWGVPQRRRRIFLVADFTGQCAAEILFEQGGLSGDTQKSRKAREEVAAGAGNGVRTTGATLGCRNDQTLISGTVSAKWAKGTGCPAGDECQNLVAFGPGGQGNVAHALRSQPSKADKPDSTTYLLARYKNNVDGVVEDEVTATLRSCGSATHERKIPAMVTQGQAVRRLTPLECERLQGFPDGWTDIPGASDTGRYKALGNSVAVPCVAWIMGRIKAAIKVMGWNS